MRTAAAATLGRGFDVVHFHAVGPGLFSPLVRCFSRARVVQTIHGLDGERAKWGRGASGLLRFGTWLSAKVPHATIVVSKALQDAYRERYGRETVHIVNGAPEVSARPAAAITERWGLTKGSYVLFVGRLVPEKAPEHLLSAFADVPGDTRLVVAGGSSHTDEYVADLHAAGRRRSPDHHGRLRLRRGAGGALLERRGVRAAVAARGPPAHAPRGRQLRLLDRGQRHPSPRRGHRLVRARAGACSRPATCPR